MEHRTRARYEKREEKNTDPSSLVHVYRSNSNKHDGRCHPGSSSCSEACAVSSRAWKAENDSVSCKLNYNKLDKKRNQWTIIYVPFNPGVLIMSTWPNTGLIFFVVVAMGLT